MIQYPKNKILYDVIQAAANAETMYQSPVVRHIGRTKDTKEFYSEVVAEWLLKNDFIFDCIETIDVDGNYNQEHIVTGSKKYASGKNREDHYPKQMYAYCNDGETKQKYSEIGRIIDFQVPLDPTQNISKVGKIDLFSKNGKKVYLLEYKVEDNAQESLLRAVLEIYTYFRQLNHKKFKRQYKNLGIEESDNIIPAVLIYENKKSAQFNQCDKTQYPSLWKLIKNLKIKVFVISGRQDRVDLYKIQEVK